MKVFWTTTVVISLLITPSWTSPPSPPKLSTFLSLNEISGCRWPAGFKGEPPLHISYILSMEEGKGGVPALTAALAFLNTETIALKLFFPQESAGSKYALCGLRNSDERHPGSFHGIRFVRCMLESLEEMQKQARAPAACGGKSLVETMTCLERELNRIGTSFVKSDHARHCALVDGLDWNVIESCANGPVGEALSKESRSASIEIMQISYESRDRRDRGGAENNQFTSADSLIGRVARGDVKKATPKADLETGALPGRLPLVVFRSHVESSEGWGRSDYIDAICRFIQQMARAEVDRDLETSALWAWISGSALAISAIIAGVSVTVLYQHEESWKVQA